MVVSAGLALKVAVLSLHGNPRTSNSGALSAVLSLHTVHIFNEAFAKMSPKSPLLKSALCHPWLCTRVPGTPWSREDSLYIALNKITPALFLLLPVGREFIHC